LTDPIFIALARYLKEARPADIVKAMECAQILVRECFVGGGRGLTPEYMARLGTVCEGIAHVIGLQPKVKGEVDAQEVALRAAQALRSAPTAAVTGTLHCWVEALTVRARESKLGEDERLALRRACEERKADPQYVAAFAELLPYLR
jgi:hypothetical protein